MTKWKENGVDTVLSLLERSEEDDLGLRDEAEEVRAHGMRFRSFPIADRQTPESRLELTRLLEEMEQELQTGRNLVLHCRQGVGRTGVVAASLFVMHGEAPDLAVERLSEARGVAVPETEAQLSWIKQFAETLAVLR